MVSNNNRLIEAIQNHKLVVIVDLPLVSLHSNELSKSKLTIELKKFCLYQVICHLNRLLILPYEHRAKRHLFLCLTE